MMRQVKLNLFTYCENKILGFSLIEVLIALAMTAIGLLGFMQLQMRALYTAQEAANTITANILARDMIGRVLANPPYPYNLGTYDNYTPYGYNLRYPLYYYTADRPANTANAPCYNPSSPTAPQVGCQHDQIAHLDIDEWTVQVAKLLPNGKALICNDPSYNPGGDNADPLSVFLPVVARTKDTLYTIKIFWQARDLTWRNYLAYVRPYNRE